MKICALVQQYVTGDTMLLADRRPVKFNCLQNGHFQKFTRLRKFLGLQPIATENTTMLHLQTNRSSPFVEHKRGKERNMLLLTKQR